MWLTWFQLFADIPTIGSTIQAMFAGRYENKITCHQCSHTSVTDEAFRDVSISISDPSVRSLPAAFQATFQTEVLRGENQYFCSHCKKHVDATRKQSVSSAPPFLWLQLKRFQTDITHTSTSKITKPIGFSETFRIPSATVSDAVYTLHAVVNHHGSNSGGGHYTATVRNPVQVQTGTDNNWLHFNDSRVQIQSKRAAFNFTDAYLLLFIKTSIYDSINSEQGTQSSASLPGLQHPMTSLRDSPTKRLQTQQNNCIDSTSHRRLRQRSRQKKKLLLLDLEADCSDSSSTISSEPARKPPKNRLQLRKKQPAVYTVTEDTSDSEYQDDSSSLNSSPSTDTEVTLQSGCSGLFSLGETSPSLLVDDEKELSSSIPHLHWNMQIWGDGIGATPSGISSLHGTSSYASSVVQYLAYIPAFSEMIMTSTLTSSGNDENGSLRSALVLHLQHLFHQMHARDYPRIYPNKLLQTLPRFGNNIKTGGPLFLLGRKEDAYTFLSTILAKLNKHDQVGTGSALPATMLDSVFNGTLTSHGSCEHCAHSEIKAQSFTSLSLDLHDKYLDVQTTLDHFFTSGYQHICQNCNNTSPHQDQPLHVSMLPTCLQLKLNRFTLQETQVPGVYQPRKITTPIAVNKTINVSDVHGTTCSYLLCGMIIHDGSSDPNQGHYRAIVNDPIHPDIGSTSYV